MKNNKNASFALALGATFVSGLSMNAVMSTSALAEDSNPFLLTELPSGYMQLAENESSKGKAMKMKDGACGEGKCGSSMMEGAEEKNIEGQCAGNKPMPADYSAKKGKAGKCGEGKCGEGKCGTSKN